MDPQLDRVADLLRRSPRFAIALDELAADAGLAAPDSGALDALVSRVRADPRFLVAGGTVGGLQAFDLWPDDRRRAYADVLRQIGLPGPCLVVLRAPPAGATLGPPTLAALLRASALTLLESDPAPGLAAAAERLRAAVDWLSEGPGGTAPSTTRLPGPPCPAGTRTPPPRPRPGPLPSRGSRRGSAAPPPGAPPRSPGGEG